MKFCPNIGQLYLFYGQNKTKEYNNRVTKIFFTLIEI